jgi:hypothetical protein
VSQTERDSINHHQQQQQQQQQQKQQQQQHSGAMSSSSTMAAPSYRQTPGEEDWTVRTMAGFVQMLTEAPDLAYLHQYAHVVQQLRAFFEEAATPPEQHWRDIHAYMRVGVNGKVLHSSRVHSVVLVYLLIRPSCCRWHRCSFVVRRWCLCTAILMLTMPLN